MLCIAATMLFLLGTLAYAIATPYQELTTPRILDLGIALACVASCLGFWATVSTARNKYEFEAACIQAYLNSGRRPESQGER